MAHLAFGYSRHHQVRPAFPMLASGNARGRSLNPFFSLDTTPFLGAVLRTDLQIFVDFNFTVQRNTRTKRREQRRQGKPFCRSASDQSPAGARYVDIRSCL